jgi:K+-transporting ATPase ATPase B chain
MDTTTIPQPATTAPEAHGHHDGPANKASLFEPAIVRRAVGDAFRKLDPRQMAKNPVMFIVEIGSVYTTLLFLKDLPTAGEPHLFTGLVAAWLWFTVLFANFAEAVAEGRGKAQADTLRKTRSETVARVRLPDGTLEERPSPQLRPGDLCVVRPGETIPGDGEVVEGIASVDESAITGESAPVIRESGGDRSAVTGGTGVLSDEIVVRITQEPGAGFIDRMIALVEGAERQKTPNEIALNILLCGLTIIFASASATSPRCASWPSCGSPTRSTTPSSPTRTSTASTARGRRASGWSSPSPARRAGST